MALVYLFGIATFFQTALAGAVSPLFSMLDEVFLLVAIVYLAIKKIEDKELRALRGLLIFLFFIFVVTSFNSFGLRPIWMIILQSIIHLKFFIFLVFFIVILDGRKCSSLVHVLFALTILGFLLNLALGDTMNDWVGARVQYRLGELRPVGFQADTGNLGSMAAFCFLFYMFRKGVVTIAKFCLATLTMLVFGVLSSVRTPFISIVYSTIGAIAKSPKILFAGFIVTAIVVGVGLNFGLQEILIKNWEITVANFDWLDDPVASAYIRGIMIYFAFALSFEYFPFGTGAASYGTVLSEGSWVYGKIGLATSRFFLETDGIYDSNFSSILGEYGYLGLFLFIFTFYRFYRYFMKQSGELKYGVLAFFLLIATYSLVNPIFMNAYSSILFPIILVALVNGRRDTSPDAK